MSPSRPGAQDEHSEARSRDRPDGLHGDFWGYLPIIQAGHTGTSPLLLRTGTDNQHSQVFGVEGGGEMRR